MSLDLCGMSDLHGYLPPVEDIRVHEVTCICGDFSPLNIQVNNRKIKKWLIEVFKPWAESLPSNKVYFISGNHEVAVFRDPDFMHHNFSITGKVVYLNSSGDLYKAKDGNSYEIYGCPWCQSFGNWAFMTNDSELEKIYSAIPNNLDILLCHDCPYGYGDILLEYIPYHNEDEHIGNKVLLGAIFRKQPKYLLHGHLHSVTHECVEIGLTQKYNVSIMTERYEPLYDPLYITIEPNNGK